MRSAFLAVTVLMVAALGSGCIEYLAKDDDKGLNALEGPCKQLAVDAIEPVLVVEVMRISGTNGQELGHVAGARINITFADEAKPYESRQSDAGGCVAFRHHGDGHYQVHLQGVSGLGVCATYGAKTIDRSKDVNMETRLLLADPCA